MQERIDRIYTILLSAANTYNIDYRETVPGWN